MKRVLALCLLALSVASAARPLAWLGLGVRPFRDQAGRRLLHVEHVAVGGPADRAGLRLGDVITEFGGNALQIGDDLDFLLFVAEHKPNDRLFLTVVRHGAAQKMMVTFGQMPESARELWNRSLESARRSRIAASRPAQ